MQKIFYPKLFSVLKAGIDRHQLYRDVLSGIVVGIVALPLSIAFAVASGVSPEKGIITAIVAGFLISFLGGSRVQIGGPTGAFVVIIFGIVQKYGLQGLFYSTIIAGIILVIFGLLRLGSLLKYIPHPLIVGFTSGIAVVIFSTQIKDAFGLTISEVPADFIGKWTVYFQNIAQLNWSAVLITALTILIVLLVGKFTKKIPGTFPAILIMSIAVQLFHIDVTTIGSLFGAIPNSFRPEFPAFDPKAIVSCLQPALVIALLGGIESLLSATVADGMISGNHRSNTELIAQGIANIVSPLLGGIPATGAIARTATNIKNGGRTPISGIVHSVMLLLIMLFLGKWAMYIPMASLAGILIIVSFNMSEYESFAAILKGNIFDKIILLVTFLLTVFIDLVVAIEAGIVLSSLLFMKRMSDIAEKRIDNYIDSDVLEDYSSLPKATGIYEISGPLFFATARRYAQLLHEVGIKYRILIIRMRHVGFIDRTGMQSLMNTLKILRHNGVAVVLSGLNSECREKLFRNDITGLVPEENICDSFKGAVARASELGCAHG
ncbi:MAG: STAS domain-containing protein [Spirochaetales bacterium]|nr:STAS domain-containing protein [Spirochaetales bacterium]